MYMNKGDQNLFSLVKSGKLLSFFKPLQELLLTVCFFCRIGSRPINGGINTSGRDGAAPAAPPEAAAARALQKRNQSLSPSARRTHYLAQPLRRDGDENRALSRIRPPPSNSAAATVSTMSPTTMMNNSFLSMRQRREHAAAARTRSMRCRRQS